MRISPPSIPGVFLTKIMYRIKYKKYDASQSTLKRVAKEKRGGLLGMWDGTVKTKNRADVHPFCRDGIIFRGTTLLGA
jgi:hypothetical protein